MKDVLALQGTGLVVDLVPVRRTTPCPPLTFPRQLDLPTLFELMCEGTEQGLGQDDLVALILERIDAGLLTA